MSLKNREAYKPRSASHWFSSTAKELTQNKPQDWRKRRRCSFWSGRIRRVCTFLFFFFFFNKIALKSRLYPTWFTCDKFVFKLVVPCSFWVAHVIKNTLPWKPFEFKWPEVHFNRKQTSTAWVPYNKLLTNLASLDRTGEYWPSVVFVRTSLRSVRTKTISDQYSPVRPSRSVSKRLVFFLYRQLVAKQSETYSSSFNV